MENISKIRVKTGIVIEVNDNGETILIDAENQMFLEKFYDLIEQLDDLKAKAEEESKNPMEYREFLKWNMGETRKVMEKIDELFGENACKKIFGDIVPSVYALADFFIQLLPCTEQYANERQKRISSKYNRDRKGGNR